MENKAKWTSNNFKTKKNKEFKFDFKRYYILHFGTTVFMWAEDVTNGSRSQHAIRISMENTETF